MTRKPSEQPQFYLPGSNYIIDDESGFRVRVEDARIQWNGLLVDKTRWEARQPQDFVKGVRDDQSVPDPRPVAPATFVAYPSFLLTDQDGDLILDQYGMPISQGGT